MVEINPLKTRCQSLINRLNQYCLPLFEQAGGLWNGCEQSIPQDEHFIYRGHQSYQRSRIGDDMELGFRGFGNVLLLDHFGR